jgi:OOP family OmpA-OmpF porin
LEGVNFKYDSDALTTPSRAALDQVATILREQPTLKLEIAGHSDTQGDAAYNLWLSEQRAKSVMAYLVSQGVPASQLSAQGYGGSQPIADNTTREGLARNRRVELRRQP